MQGIEEEEEERGHQSRVMDLSEGLNDFAAVVEVRESCTAQLDVITWAVCEKMIR